MLIFFENESFAARAWPNSRIILNRTHKNIGSIVDVFKKIIKVLLSIPPYYSQLQREKDSYMSQWRKIKSLAENRVKYLIFSEA